MTGDHEGRDDEFMPLADFGPLDAMVRLSPPDGDPAPPAWVERYGAVIVVRHTFPDGDVTREMFATTEAFALLRYAREVAFLVSRGYAVVDT